MGDPTSSSRSSDALQAVRHPQGQVAQGAPRQLRPARTVHKEDFWALRDVDLDDRGRHDRRPHRPQRLGQEHAAQAHRRHHPADRGHGRSAAAGWPRCSSSAPGSTPTSPAARTSTSTPRSSGSAAQQTDRYFDEIVDFSGIERVHRHPGEVLLVGHVRAARLRRRRARRPRHPAGRRGAGGRRRAVPAQVHGPDPQLPARGPHDRPRHPRRRPGRRPVRPGHRARARPREGRRTRPRRAAGAAFGVRPDPGGRAGPRVEHVGASPEPARPGDEHGGARHGAGRPRPSSRDSR